jgi:hypothetical protein
MELGYSWHYDPHRFSMRTKAGHSIQWQRIEGSHMMGGLGDGNASMVEAERLDGMGAQTQPKNMKDGEDKLYMTAGARKKGAVNTARRKSIDMLIGI